MSKISNEQAPKRVKVTLACVICRKKKVKCDGIQPSCSRCQSIGNCCQYSDPPKKRGPPKGYVEVIENRAHRIESLLGNQHHYQQQQQQYEQQKQQINSNKPFIHVSVDNNDDDIINKSQQSKPNQVKENRPINALLCLIAGAVDAVREQDRAASDTIVHGSNGILYDFLMTQNVLFDNKQEEKHIFNIISNDNLTALWTENFFNQFNFMFPILSRPQFTFQLEKGELNSLLKLAVFILGCRLENNDNNSRLEKQLYQQFDDYVLSHDLLLVPDLSTVQVIVIMCWYTYIAGDMHKCYSLRYLLAQLINKLNFGYESDTPQQDIHFTEMKRRAFWVSFVIDQWLASCTGGEQLLTTTSQQNKWDCKWPQLEDNQLFALHYQQQQPKFLMNNNTSYFSIESALQIHSFNEMIRLSKIVADICNGKNLNSLESSLTKWLLQLPSYLDYGKPSSDNEEPSPIAKIYRILYYTVQIMLNNSNKNNSNGLSTSICTTAANTMIHISEQMVEHGQEKYLYNVFFLSLTLATSIHLDNTIEKEENAPDKISLYKSISTIKGANCSLLSRLDFDRLMEHFLVDRCRIVLEDEFIYPSPTNSTSVSHARLPSNKRAFIQDDDEEELAMNSPSSSSSSFIDIQHLRQNSSTAALINSNMQPVSQQQQQQHQQFDIIDIFPTMMDPAVENCQQQQQQWPTWIDLFDNQTIESSTTTCSPASYITPSHSPSLSLCLKEEDNMSFDLLSDKQFFTSFPLL